MKLLSTKVLFSVLSTLSISIALCSTASANNLNTVNFTANGKTTIKTAKLFSQLLANNSQLEVSTKILSKKPSIQTKNNSNISYTITGKTSLKKAQKLVKLFQHSNKIEVVTSISRSSEQYVRGFNYNYPVYHTSLLTPQHYYYQPISSYFSTWLPTYSSIINIDDNDAS